MAASVAGWDGGGDHDDDDGGGGVECDFGGCLELGAGSERANSPGWGAAEHADCGCVGSELSGRPPCQPVYLSL